MYTINLELGPKKQRSISLAEREITLMLGENTGNNIHASFIHAERLLHDENSGNVLYINTIQTPWKIADSARKSLPEADERYFHTYYLFGEEFRERLFFLNSELGELYKQKEKILTLCREKKISTIIINSWECAAHNSRVRDSLILLLRTFNRGDQHPVIDHEKFRNGEDPYIYDFNPATILLYAEKPKVAIERGKIQRGGFGKLAVMADQIVEIPSEVDEVAESGVRSPVSGVVKEEAMEVHLAPVFVPDLKRPDIVIAREPILLNGYAPDKLPIPNREVHSEVLLK